MDQKEKTLAIELCRFKDPDKRKLERLIKGGNATSSVLGVIFANRIAGIAYRTLKDTGLLGQTDREFRTALGSAAIMNSKRNEDFLGCLRFLSNELEACGVPYALLKGAYLCGWYPEGCRTSNDVDVLVSPKDVGKLCAGLRLAGFRQGYMRNGEFVSATRREIIGSKMMRGETVPFIMETKLTFMPYLEVDVNFSLDYRNSDDGALQMMLESGKTQTVGNTPVRTLNEEDFFLHLCVHLYKEATTLPWIVMRRDMIFYKYVDIYAMLHDFSEEMLEKAIGRAEHFWMRRELLYCLHSVEAFFGKSRYADVMRPTDEEISSITEVVSPQEKKIYRYTEPDPVKRFFAKDRAAMLSEVR